MQFACNTRVTRLQLITNKNWKCVHAIFLASVYSLVTGIPAMCYLIIVRCGQGGSKSFRKYGEILARNEAFCGHGLVSARDK